MFPSRRCAPSALCALATVLALGACTVYEDDDHHNPPPPQTPYYDFWELEPNDSHCCPDVIGDLYVGDSFVIGGTIRDDSYDPFDGFAFANGEPLDVEFWLEPIGTYADLDLCVWDPYSGEFAFCFDSPAAVESGRFSVPVSWTDFHMVVSSWSGDSEYRLHVYVQPITLGALGATGPSESKSERAVPLEQYGGGVAPQALEEHGWLPLVLRRGAYLEFGPGLAERRQLLVRRDGRIRAGPDQ